MFSKHGADFNSTIQFEILHKFEKKNRKNEKKL